MKGLTNFDSCCCGSGTYRTPWCEMLKKCDCGGSILHLWYKLPMLMDEIEKRSSYLGKFRRTEESKHLLDLIAMTRDEKDLFMPFAKAAMGDVFDVLQQYMPRYEKACWWDEGRETAVFTDTPALPSPAVTFSAGQYVEYNGDLYIAVEDGSSDDFTGKLAPTEDYRNSIHYGILWGNNLWGSSNINVVEPLDTAVFEALVARIIYKWLSYAYPDEAARYLGEWNELEERMRRRCNMLFGARIVNRIPRIF